MKPSAAAQIAARLDRLPSSRTIWTIIVLISLGGLAAAFAGLMVGFLLADGGVPAVAVFIGTAMIVGIAAIGAFGPSTRGVALEQLND